MTNLYTLIKNNYDKLFQLISTDAELLSHVNKNNFYRDIAYFGDTTWPDGIAILDPVIQKGEQSFGLETYILTYDIEVYTKQLPHDQSRDMLMKMMDRIVELCDIKTNASLSDTCTFMKVLNANPRPKRGLSVSGKTSRRRGEIRIQAHLSIALTT